VCFHIRLHAFELRRQAFQSGLGIQEHLGQIERILLGDPFLANPLQVISATFPVKMVSAGTAPEIVITLVSNKATESVTTLSSPLPRVSRRVSNQTPCPVTFCRTVSAVQVCRIYRSPFFMCAFKKGESVCNARNS
jgi:hypothetical protein